MTLLCEPCGEELYEDEAGQVDGILCKQCWRFQKPGPEKTPAEYMLKHSRAVFVPDAPAVLFWQWVVDNDGNFDVAIRELGLEPPRYQEQYFGAIMDLVTPFLVARHDAEKWFDDLRPPRQGDVRDWVKCRKCGCVAYHDYLPHGLANPIIAMPCGDGIGQRLYQYTYKIPEAEARAILVEKKMKELLESNNVDHAD